MSIAVVIENDGDAKRMVGWGVLLSRCFEVPLLVIHATKGEAGTLEQVALGPSDEPIGGMASAVLDAWPRANISPDSPDSPNSDGSDSSSTVRDDGAATESPHDPSSEPSQAFSGELSFFRLRDPGGATAVLQHLSDWRVDLLVLPMDGSKETTLLSSAKGRHSQNRLSTLRKFTILFSFLM